MSRFSWHKSIVIKAAAISALAVSLATYAAIVVNRRDDVRRFEERRYAEVEMVLQAAIDPRFQTKAEEIARVAERLVVIEAIKGGALFDESGHALQVFGERPLTDFQAVMQTGRQIFLTRDANRIEFYYPPEHSHTPFFIVVRAAFDELPELEAIGELRAVLISLAAGLAGALAATLFTLFWVSLPARRLARAARQIVDDPAMIEEAVRLKSGGSEIGALNHSLDFLRSTLADIWRTKVLVAEAILETSPFAIVQMTAEGTPIFANPASTTLFGRDVIHSFGTSPLVVRDVEAQSRNNLKFEIDSHKDLRLIEVGNGQPGRYAMLGSLVVGKDTRSAYTVGLMADVTPLQEARLGAEGIARDLQAQVRMAGLKELELKLMLESCLTLLGGGKAEEVHIDAAPFAREWLEPALQIGLVAHAESSDEGPQVAGAQDDLRSVVRLSMLAATARCGVTPVDLTFDLRGINFETVGLEVVARPGGAGTQRPCSVDANLVLAALRVACKRIGAQLGDVALNDGVSQVRMTLRGAAERMATGMKAPKES